MPDIQIVDVLRTLAGGGSTALVLWVLTQVGEKWAWYQALSKLGKQIVAGLLSALVGISALAIVTYTPDAFWLFIQPYFVTALAAVVPIFGSAILHFLTNKWGPTIQAQAQGLKAIQESGALLVIPTPNGPLPQVEVVEKLAETGSAQSPETDAERDRRIAHQLDEQAKAAKQQSSDQ